MGNAAIQMSKHSGRPNQKPHKIILNRNEASERTFQGQACKEGEVGVRINNWCGHIKAMKTVKNKEETAGGQNQNKEVNTKTGKQKPETRKQLIIAVSSSLHPQM